MNEIEALEARIATALGRIRAGVAARPAADPEMAQRLEDERAANEQLQQRVVLLKERQDTRVAALEQRVESQRVQLAKLDEEVQRLRAINADLQQVSAQLRAAAASTVTPAELVNRAMIAEIDALDAQRRAEAAEVSAILSELKPLIEEA